MKHYKEFKRLLKEELLTDYDAISIIINNQSIKTIIELLIDYPLYYFYETYIYHSLKVSNEIIKDKITAVEFLPIKSIVIDKNISKDKLIKAINMYYKEIFNEYIVNNNYKFEFDLEITSDYIQISFPVKYCDKLKFEKYYLN